MAELPPNGKFLIFDDLGRGKRRRAKCFTTQKYEELELADLTPYGLCTAEYFRKLILDAYDEGRLCANGPNPEDPDAIGEYFLQEALKKNTVFVLLVEESTSAPTRGVSTRKTNAAPKNIVRGFALLDPHSPTDLYIDLICATRPRGVVTADAFSGRTLLKFILEFARVMGFESVSLSALPRVLNYYPKLGMDFNFRKSCRDPIVPVPEALLAKGVRLMGEDPYAPENEAFRDFIYTLHEAGLEHSHEYDAEKDRRCKSVRGTKSAVLSELKRYECENDGFYMAKCNVQPEEYARPSKRQR